MVMTARRHCVRRAPSSACEFRSSWVSPAPTVCPSIFETATPFASNVSSVVPEVGGCVVLYSNRWTRSLAI